MTVRRLCALGPLLFTLAWAVLGAADPSYDQARDTISALASYDVPRAGVMVAAFVVQGVAQTVLGWSVVRGGRGRAAGWALVVSGLGTLGAGVVRLPDHSTGHAVAATAAFAGLHLAALAAVVRPPSAGRALPSLALLVALPHLAWFLVLLADGGGAWFGFAEKVFTTALLCWTAVLALSPYSGDLGAAARQPL